MHTDTHATPGEQARAAARERTNIRERIRAAAADTFRGRPPSFRQLSSVVNDMFAEVADEMRSAIPQDRQNVLRQVYEGLEDAAEAASESGRKVIRDTREHARNITDKAPAAARRVGAATEQLWEAVSAFASRTSAEVGAELNDVVKRARTAGPKVMEGVKDAATAAGNSRVAELAGETMRAGAHFARGAARDIASAAGGLIDGFAEAIAPAPRPARRPAASSSPRTRAKPAKARKTQTGRAGAVVKKSIKRKATRAVKAVKRAARPAKKKRSRSR